jgi:hypothetical protein
MAARDCSIGSFSFARPVHGGNSDSGSRLQPCAFSDGESSNGHPLPTSTVKPWFNGKLDFPAGARSWPGISVVGGLDYVDNSRLPRWFTSATNISSMCSSGPPQSQLAKQLARQGYIYSTGIDQE